jgi:hypothetical protein
MAVTVYVDKSGAEYEISGLGLQPDEISLGVVDNKLAVLRGGITAEKLDAGAVTDAKIGTRTLEDQTADGTLISVIAKTFSEWLQGIRNNLKHVFEQALFKSNTAGFFKSDGTTGYPSKSDVELGNVDNTSDINKPVSTAQAEAIAAASKTTLADQSASDTLPATTESTLASLLQTVRNFLKLVKDKALFKKSLDWFTVTLSGNWRGVAYGAGKFAAVSYNGKIAYSADGVSWSTVTLSGAWTDITYAAGKFVAVGEDKTAYSTDGVSWTTGDLSGA